MPSKRCFPKLNRIPSPSKTTSFLQPMDLTNSPSSNLSLGLPSSSAASPSHRTAAADNPYQPDDSASNSNANSLTLRFIDDRGFSNGTLPESSANREDDVADGEDGGDGADVEEFRILGHCIKRKRDAESTSSSSTNHIRSCSDEADLEARRAAVRSWGNQPLRAADPDVFEIVEKEKGRQFRCIELIASENFVCKAVMEALGSHLTNKYSEGMPGARYYGGNQFIDEIENLCHERALAAFDLSPENWGVNVQPYSCTSANFAVFTGLLLPGDRVMGLDMISGGNTSHGCYMPDGRKVSATSIFFESFPYKINPQTGYIDFEKLEERAMDFRPKILICGGSSYPREWDYGRFRLIADKCGATLMCDMAQISGLIAAKECASPFEHCDVVTSTTHKSLRGPRGGIIFSRKGMKPRKGMTLSSQGNEGERYDLEEKINFALFPSLQGGPHNNHIAALAIALKQVATPEYKAYMKQVKKNAQALASALLRRKCRLITGGTDNHLLLWDLRPLGLIGWNFEKVCEKCHITLNKIAIIDDNGTITPGGVRIGTPAMTTRGCLESDFETITDFLFKAAQITSTIQRVHGKLQKPFLKGVQINKEISELGSRVEAFASQFSLPGIES